MIFQKDERTAFDPGSGNRIATALFYVSRNFNGFKRNITIKSEMYFSGE